MSITLHLGVDDVPYTTGSATTGDVAERLEKDYGVMEYFVYKFNQEIAEELETDLSALIQDILNNKVTSKPFSDSCQNIERKFKKALQQRFMDGSNFSDRPVPTLASLGGISGRFKDRKNLKRKRGVRPSFVDTGLYRQSFKAWVEL